MLRQSRPATRLQHFPISLTSILVSSPGLTGRSSNHRSGANAVRDRKERNAMSKSTRPARPTRRNFLKVAAATATASAVAAPNVVSAQGVINMRWQSTWPSKDIFHEYAQDYAKLVNDMT